MVESGTGDSGREAQNETSSNTGTEVGSSTGTLRGTVKWFNDAKGFGFIEHGSGKDVFVHYSSIISEGFKSLKDGEEVEYEMMQGQKGLHAVKVVRLSKPSSATEGAAPSVSTGETPEGISTEADKADKQ